MNIFKIGYRKILDRLDDAPFMRKAHGWLAIGWLALSIPICIFLADSVPFIVFISVYAVVVSHWSSWQAARVEVRQDEIEKKKEQE